jgi:hypothetical protein
VSNCGKITEQLIAKDLEGSGTDVITCVFSGICTKELRNARKDAAVRWAEVSPRAAPSDPAAGLRELAV